MEKRDRKMKWNLNWRSFSGTSMAKWRVKSRWVLKDSGFRVKGRWEWRWVLKESGFGEEKVVEIEMGFERCWF